MMFFFEAYSLGLVGELFVGAALQAVMAYRFLQCRVGQQVI